MESESEEDVAPLVTAAERRKRQRGGRRVVVGGSSSSSSKASSTKKKMKKKMKKDATVDAVAGEGDGPSSAGRELGGPGAVDAAAGAAAGASDNSDGSDGSDDDDDGPAEVGISAPKSLLELSLELKRNPNFEKERREAEEAKFLETVKAQQKALSSSREKAGTGTAYTESLQSGWRASRRVRELPAEAHDELRKKYHILVDGDDVPAPALSFRDMKLPKALVAGLASKGILRPTPIQIQGLPVAMSGRDMIGIAFTGSGKTITFTVPLVMLALGEQMKLPLVGGEGPCGIIVGPSRELQSQTCEVVQHFCDALTSGGHPELRVMLCIGGQDKKEQLGEHVRKGTHMVVATPGRLNDFLKRGDMNLDVCRYVCLDEGDRMMDHGFDEEIQSTLGFCKMQRQMLLFSATMPKKFVDFAQTSLVRPVTVNVGRAGAANMDVIQEVEFVKPEKKIVYLLHCLQKSPPPVVIFCESQRDCDDVVEYLLIKGVEAVAIHGGKDQLDRAEAMRQFKRLEKDVLVATDIAAKGLDFPDIQHVINFDMPKEIENYVHRIGRTGRCGKTGVATTFINNGVDPSLLLDLKHLLKEAKQRLPPTLQSMEDAENHPDDDGNPDKDSSCAYCGGLGHRITDCPKLQTVLRSQQAQSRDIVGGAAHGGNW